MGVVSIHIVEYTTTERRSKVERSKPAASTASAVLVVGDIRRKSSTQGCKRRSKRRSSRETQRRRKSLKSNLQRVSRTANTQWRWKSILLSRPPAAATTSTTYCLYPLSASTRPLSSTLFSDSSKSAVTSKVVLVMFNRPMTTSILEMNCRTNNLRITMNLLNLLPYCLSTKPCCQISDYYSDSTMLV